MQNRSLALSAPRQITAAEADLTSGAMSVQDVLGQLSLIQQVMNITMKDGQHYGKIPGCGDKPALLKPGAEKLCLTFRLAASYDTQITEMERGHREVRVTCSLSSILHQNFVGSGVGSCSTMESKYRYRGAVAEETDRPVPRGYWDVRKDDPAKAQEMIGGKGFTTKKIEGKGWMICKSTGEKLENADLADQYNTVLKMAKKRALVDAVLTATAASDIFAQDIEDLAANMDASREQEGQARQPDRPRQPVQEAEIVDERPAPPAEVWPVRGVITSVAKRKTSDKDVFDVTICDDKGKDVKASTFSTTVGPRAQEFEAEGTPIIAGIKKAKKEGYFVLASLETAESVDADGDSSPRSKVMDYPADAPDADPTFTSAKAA